MSKIEMEMPDDVYQSLSELAETNGRTLEQMLLEALRLERLFLETKKKHGEFLVRDTQNGPARVLLGV